MNQWMELADRVLAGAEVTDEEALSILNCPDEDILLLMHGAFSHQKTLLWKKVKAQYDYECEIRALPGKLRLLFTVCDFESAD